ncbi:MAG: FliM/FliN family flagellar motor switch protein [bacterium]
MTSSQHNYHIESDGYSGHLDYSRSFTMFENAFCPSLQEISHSILNANLYFKLISMTSNDNIWKGEEFFVTQISLNDKCAITFKISSDAAGIVLYNSLGGKNGTFEEIRIKDITKLESRILTVYIEYLFKNFKELFLSGKKALKFISQGSNYKKMLHLTFSLYSEQHEEESVGKLVISFPEFIYKQVQYIEEQNDLLDIMQFEQSATMASIYVGKSKITLEGIKNLESDDYIILENSNLNQMTILAHEPILFNVNPNPSIVVDIDDEDEVEMTDMEQRSIQDIWDSLQVDVSAEFEKIKMTLGELRQISEGLVVDIAPIVRNEITLSVESKKIASGELVIIGDKYGVKINKVYHDPKPQAEPEQEEPSNEDYSENMGEGEQINLEEMDDSDFDYSDFEIDDDL